MAVGITSEGVVADVAHRNDDGVPKPAAQCNRGCARGPAAKHNATAKGLRMTFR